MIIGTVTSNGDNRVAITPETAKKISDLGHEVLIQNDSGKNAGFPDSSYKEVKFEDRKEVLKQSDVLLTISGLSDKEHPKKEAIVIGMLKNKPEYKSFNLLSLPRVTRAQSMDVLSSQSNLAGYRAVIEGAAALNKIFPLLMTAAGTIPAARVLILGAGVAGLQAIATAKRLGAIVSAFDVRPLVKEQVESLGGSFIEVDSSEIGEVTGGYAKEMSEEYKNAQRKKLHEVIKTQDLVISTALIPGKKAPILITKDMVNDMKPGAVIVDLAGESGGNCELSVFKETVIENKVKIITPFNLLNSVPYDASLLYARNIFNFFRFLLDKDGKELNIQNEDEIIKNTF